VDNSITKAATTRELVKAMAKTAKLHMAGSFCADKENDQKGCGPLFY
jgi:hypothetical protein